METVPVYCLADCAARVFAQWRTSKHPETDYPNVRHFLRAEPVAALRYLWATGDAHQRMIVACRVAVWMERPVREIQERVLARERKRGAPC